MQPTRFQRALSLRRLRELSFELYKSQSNIDQKSPDLQKFAFRRVYRLAILKIVASEYIRNSSELSTSSPRFGQVLFPFSGVQNGQGLFNALIIESNYFFTFTVFSGCFF